MVARTLSLMSALLAIAVSVIGALLAVSHYLASHSAEILFHSDMLYLPAIYRDIWIDGNSLFAWSFTPAPYFFPDMSLYFLLHWITGDPAVATRFYAMVALMGFILLHALLMVRLERELLPWHATDIRENFRLASFAGYTLFIAAMVVVLLENFDPVVTIVLPSAHSGAYLCAILAFTLRPVPGRYGGEQVAGLRFYENGEPIDCREALPWTRTKAIAWNIFFIAVTVSDLSFLLYYWLPYLMAYLFINPLWHRRFWSANSQGMIHPKLQRKTVLVEFAPLLYGIAAALLIRLVVRIEPPISIAPAASLRFFWRDMAALLANENSRLIVGMVAGSMLLALILSGRIAMLQYRGGSGIAPKFADRSAIGFLASVTNSFPLTVQMLLAGGLIWLIPPMLGFHIDLYSMRYSIFFPFLFLMVTGVVLYREFGNRGMIGRSVAIVAAVIGLIVAVEWSSQVVRLSMEGRWRLSQAVNYLRLPRYTANQRCVDSIASERYIDSALADYWHAKPLYVFSRIALHVHHVDYTTLAPSRILASASWSVMPDGRRRNYRIFVVSGLHPENVERRYGSPDEKLHCPQDELWIYRKLELPSP